MEIVRGDDRKKALEPCVRDYHTQRALGAFLATQQKAEKRAFELFGEIPNGSIRVWNCPAWRTGFLQSERLDEGARKDLEPLPDSFDEPHYMYE